MASQVGPGSADRADALRCRSAALLLRAGLDAPVAGEDLAVPLGRLLSAVSLELGTHRAALPAAVRRAVVQLAEHLVRRSSIPVAPGSTGGGEPPERPRPHHRGSAVAEHRSAVPFTQSIRLGRMG